MFKADKIKERLLSPDQFDEDEEACDQQKSFGSDNGDFKT